MRRYSLFFPKAPFHAIATVLAPNMGAARIALLASTHGAFATVAASGDSAALKVDRTPAPKLGHVVLDPGHWAVGLTRALGGVPLQITHVDGGGDAWVEAGEHYPYGVCVGPMDRPSHGAMFTPWKAPRKRKVKTLFRDLTATKVAAPLEVIATAPECPLKVQEDPTPAPAPGTIQVYLQKRLDYETNRRYSAQKAMEELQALLDGLR